MAMKFRAHDTFFIRKGWLSKGMKCVELKPNIFVDKNENPMDILGIGSNMVKALRYWLQAVGLTWEPNAGRRDQNFTRLGEQIWHNDPYMEELGTLFLLQYELATDRDNATAWYYFFNEFSMSEFTREDFVRALQNYILMAEDGGSVATRSLGDDFACIINTYLPRYKINPEKISPENNIDCPFGELGLVDILDKRKKTYRKLQPSVESIDPWVAYAVIMDQANNRVEIGLNEILSFPKNLGKVFNLDSIGMLNVLHKIEKLGLIKIIRTAGLDVIHINTPMTFEQCVDSYYATLAEGV